MRKKEILSLSSAAFKKVLEENIYPFWQKIVDQENGGFIGRVDGRGNVNYEADKGIILNTRLLWSFSAFYRYTQEKELLEMAGRAYAYLNQHFLDQEYGGYFWSLDFKGRVKEPKKQIYAQVFAIYALVEFYRITKDLKVLEEAIKIFRLIENNSFDEHKNGYYEAFDRKWNFLEDLRLSVKDANEAKTMNTHLHILEAYTSLIKVWDDHHLAKQLKNLINLFLTKFLHESGHLNLFFDENWKLKSEKFSYGHDIEAGWLLCKAANATLDPDIIYKCNSTAIQLTNAALEGMDIDGGLMNEGTAEGVEDTDKHWWPQAEALVGLINAWEISREEKYLYCADKVWHFIQDKIIDYENGDWHWMTNKEGVVNLAEDKAGPWKSCYHNGRSMLELIKRFSKFNL